MKGQVMTSTSITNKTKGSQLDFKQILLKLSSCILKLKYTSQHVAMQFDDSTTWDHYWYITDFRTSKPSYQAVEFEPIEFIPSVIIADQSHTHNSKSFNELCALLHVSVEATAWK